MTHEDFGVDLAEVARLERKFRHLWRRIDCVACGHDRGVGIVYGLPGDPDLVEAAELGIVRLGGCVIGDDSPEIICAACGRTLTWVDPM